MSRAFHDYRCPHCGHIGRDHLVEISVGASAGAPECPACLTLDHVVTMEWIPKIGRMDASSGPGFTGFDTFDGQNNRVHVGSLHQLRQLERQSEQQHKNGEGQPLVFRAFSNNPSNKDQSALHPNFTGGEQPTESAKRRFGGSLQKSADAPDTGFGPGVSDANASALND